ncbi:MAG: hypothetical protein P3W93_004265 [Thermus sp.]|nr:hypothetical protein [Thermus sp.]
MTARQVSRIQAGLGCEPRGIQEGLEGLRQVLEVDEVKQEFYQATRKGARLERLSREDGVVLMTRAALKDALEKARKRLGHGAPSTLAVRTEDLVKEGVKRVGMERPGSSPWSAPVALAYRSQGRPRGGR